MKLFNRIKRPTILLIVAGSIFMSFDLITHSYFEISKDVCEFLKAFGASLVCASLFVQLKLETKDSAPAKKMP